MPIIGSFKVICVMPISGFLTLIVVRRYTVLIGRYVYSGRVLQANLLSDRVPMYTSFDTLPIMGEGLIVGCWRWWGFMVCDDSPLLKTS